MTAHEGFALAVRLTASPPGLTTEQRRQLVDGAHQLCPNSHATRGNIDVLFDIRCERFAE
ncbi:MAG: hypothetical protein JF607_08235 [Burkholderiales bacterium]|jgi:osmotically inducible protein OsmC|nr:hypothetical protein [Burkholderiales bacterium]